MSESLHVCKICGKKFATAKAVHGHQRIHSGPKRIPVLKESRVCSISTSVDSETLDPLRRGCKSNSSLPLKNTSSFMTDTEKHEMNDAAMSLVMFSERVSSVIRNLPPGDIAMDLEKTIHCVVSKQEFSDVSTTGSDVVPQALPSPLGSKSLTKRESNFSYKFKICGKIFERSQTLGGHQTLHSSNEGQLAGKKGELEVGDSLSVLSVSGAKKVVPQLSCFEVPQKELIELRDPNAKGHWAESRQYFSEVFSHLSFEQSSTCSDVVAQPLPFPLRSKFQEKPQSNSSYKCKLCGEGFGCSQALGSHQRVHRPISLMLGRKRKRVEDVNSLSGSSEAKKIVSQPPSLEVSQEELIEHKDTDVKEHCVELKQDFEKSSACSDVLAQALPTLLRCNVQKRAQSNSSYKCKICGKSFGCSQALGGHQRLHRSMKGQLALDFEDVTIHRMTQQKLRRLFQNHQSFEVLSL